MPEKGLEQTLISATNDRLRGTTVRHLDIAQRHATLLSSEGRKKELKMNSEIEKKPTSRSFLRAAPRTRGRRATQRSRPRPPRASARPGSPSRLSLHLGHSARPPPGHNTAQGPIANTKAQPAEGTSAPIDASRPWAPLSQATPRPEGRTLRPTASAPRTVRYTPPRSMATITTHQRNEVQRLRHYGTRVNKH